MEVNKKNSKVKKNGEVNYKNEELFNKNGEVNKKNEDVKKNGEVKKENEEASGRDARVSARAGLINQLKSFRFDPRIAWCDAVLLTGCKKVPSGVPD